MSVSEDLLPGQKEVTDVHNFNLREGLGTVVDVTTSEKSDHLECGPDILNVHQYDFRLTSFTPNIK